MRGLITAIRTLTLLPVPGRESAAFSSSLPWFPWVGLILGGVLYGLGALWLGFLEDPWPEGGGALLLAAGVLLTGGLHLDGLADWADALGAKRGQEQRLAIMKDPHLGSFGVLALIILLLVKWIALRRIVSAGSILWLLPIGIVSRGMMVELISTLPYARSGDGTARPFLEGVTRKHRIWAHAAAFALCLCLGPGGAIAFGVGWLATRVLRWSFLKGFGGITGDLLGTNTEIVEALLLFLCAWPGVRLLHMTGWSWV